MRLLEKCRWTPRWVSHLGCLRGCLDYLGIQISDAWLYGGTGHAFVINLHEEVCPSGPTAWKTVKLSRLGKNLGYSPKCIFGFSHQDDFPALQQDAWQHARQAMDQGHPCYAWDLEHPEFYVIYGYDEVGYYYSGPGCEAGKGPKPWQAFGDTPIGVLELYSVAPGPKAEDAVVVRQALSFALEHAASPNPWIFDHYASGVAGYDTWICALQEGKASDMGMRYNTGVWLECRRYAVSFLREAKERLAGRADGQFDQAIGYYQAVAENLGMVAEIYPWTVDASDEDRLPVDERSQAAVASLQTARQAEAAGLQVLEQIVANL